MVVDVRQPPPSIDRKVAFLRQRCGPGDAAIETHFAWIFLLGDLAWKLRKPVRREGMDYATLDARRAGSFEEVRLNRRLAPDVYLRATPLMLQPDGQLAIDGDGEVVDWLVCMRRLERRRQLDALLAHRDVVDTSLEGIAHVLATFYRAAATALPGAETLSARLLRQVDRNHGALRTVDLPGATRLRDSQRHFVELHAALLAARTGCIVEGHGDLRPEHVFVVDDAHPVVIDCLEFDRDLRILDRAEELCFLELECARLGHGAAGARIRSTCLAELADEAPAKLLNFYRSHRAATRAKLYLWRADEPDGADPSHWRQQAAAYAGLALESVRRALADRVGLEFR
jgi:aminoglycoside phosphotransferase family enzyme